MASKEAPAKPPARSMGRGFASVDPERQREVAIPGSHAAEEPLPGPARGAGPHPLGASLRRAPPPPLDASLHEGGSRRGGDNSRHASRDHRS